MKKYVSFIVAFILVFSLVPQVSNAASSISLSAKANQNTLKYKGSTTISYVVKKNGKKINKPRVTLRSSNKKVLTVSSKGVVKGVGVGKAYIYATGYGKKVSIPITISREVWNKKGEQFREKIDTSFDNKYFSSGPNTYLLETGEFDKNLGAEGLVYFSEDGLVYFTGNAFNYYTKSYELYDRFDLGTEHFKSDFKNGIAFSTYPYAGYAVLRSSDNKINVNEILDVKIDSKFSREKTALSKDGSVLAIAYSNNQIVLYDTSSGNYIQDFSIDGAIFDVTFSNSKTVYISTYLDGRNFIYVYNTETRKVVKKVNVTKNYLREIEVSEDGKRIAVTSQSHSEGLRVYDQNFTLLFKVRLYNANWISFTKDSKFILVGRYNGISKYYVR